MYFGIECIESFMAKFVFIHLPQKEMAHLYQSFERQTDAPKIALFLTKGDPVGTWFPSGIRKGSNSDKVFSENEKVGDEAFSRLR